MTGAFAAVFCLAFTVFNIFSLGLLGWRCRVRKQPLASRLLKTGLAAPTPPVSIVRPVCGLETHSELTLRSTFELEYPDYEVLFCVQKKNDPIIPLLEKLVAEQPEGRGHILIGDDPISPNPKLNNCFKGWQAAKHQFIVLADFERAGAKRLSPADAGSLHAHRRPGVLAPARRHAAGGARPP